MNVCKVYRLREDVEYQCVCEDSQTRIYLSLVRKPIKEEQRRNRIRKISRKKKVIRIAKELAKETMMFVSSISVGFVVYSALAEKLYEIRGYEAVGGEVIFAGFIAVAMYYLLETLFD